jgi:hypothetical protein
MPREYRPINFQRPQNLEHVIRQPLVVISRRGSIRHAEASPRDGVHTAAARKLGTDIVEDVRRVA